MSDGKGVRYNASQRSELYTIMGEQGYFAKKLKGIMNTHGDFVQSFKKARAEVGILDKTKWENVYVKIDVAMEQAKALAEVQLSTREAVQQTRYQQKLIESSSKKGDLQAIQKIIQIPK